MCEKYEPRGVTGSPLSPSEPKVRTLCSKCRVKRSKYEPFAQNGSWSAQTTNPLLKVRRKYEPFGRRVYPPPTPSLLTPYRWHRIVADTGSGAKRTNPLSQKGRRTNQHGRSPIPWAQKGGQTGSHGQSPVPWTSNGRRTGPHGRSPIP